MRKTCGFDFFVLAKYLDEELSGGRIEKIYQPMVGENYLFKFVVYKKERKDLIIGKEFACLTSYEIKNPSEPTPLVMFLRKRTANAFIKSITQCNRDKILRIETEDNLIFLEFFGDGNLILCGKDERIINALEKREWEGRTIKINEFYKFPEREFSERLFFGAFYEKVKNKSFEEAVSALSGFSVNPFFNALLEKKLTVKSEKTGGFDKEKKKIEFIAEQQKKKIEELNVEVAEYYKLGNAIYTNFQVLTEIYNNAKNKIPDERIKKRDANVITVDV